MFDKAYDIAVGVGSLQSDLVEKILSVERRFEDRGIIHGEVFLYIVLHFRSGRGRERNHGTGADFVDYRADPTVFRPEIMPPFRYTVSLVNCIEGNANCFEKFYIFFFCKRFRSDIEQLSRSGHNI